LEIFRSQYFVCHPVQHIKHYIIRTKGMIDSSPSVDRLERMIGNID